MAPVSETASRQHLRSAASHDSSVISTGHIRWSGVRCRRSVDVELTAETSSYSTSVFVPLLKTLLGVLMYTAH